MRTRNRTCSSLEGCQGKSTEEEPCQSASCKGVPKYNTELTPNNYTTCPNGGCGYVGGELAPILTDLASNSSKTIEVHCCNTGTASSTVLTCGNGTSCKNICGPHDSGCITVLASSSAVDREVCTVTMNEEDWCRKANVIDGLTNSTCSVNGKKTRKNTGKNPYSAVSTAIYNIWYCPGQVKHEDHLTDDRSICCLSPAVRQKVPGVIKKCCVEYGLCV